MMSPRMALTVKVAAPPGLNADVYTADDDDSWNGTDSDTSTDNGEDNITEPVLENMSHTEAAEYIYMLYHRAKRMWRRFTNRPVRRIRRNMGKFVNQISSSIETFRSMWEEFDIGDELDDIFS